jgi:hypothetical protein
LHSGGNRFTDAGNYGNTMRLAGFGPFPDLRRPRPPAAPACVSAIIGPVAATAPQPSDLFFRLTLAGARRR